MKHNGAAERSAICLYALGDIIDKPCFDMMSVRSCQRAREGLTDATHVMRVVERLHTAKYTVL